MVKTVLYLGLAYLYGGILIGELIRVWDGHWVDYAIAAALALFVCLVIHATFTEIREICNERSNTRKS